MMPVGKVPAMSQIQTKNGVAGLQHGGVSGLIGLRSGVGLHIDILRTEKFLGPLARQIFDNIGTLASAVITLAGIALRIFVGEDRPGGLEHRLADKVL